MHTQPERTGDKGIQLICQFEGLKLERYRDAVGLWTIGYGHLILKEEMEKLTKITTGEARSAAQRSETHRGRREKAAEPASNAGAIRRAGFLRLQPRRWQFKEINAAKKIQRGRCSGCRTAVQKLE